MAGYKEQGGGREVEAEADPSSHRVQFKRRRMAQDKVSVCVCGPAEALHTSQGERSSCALRACQMGRSSVLVLASWNVRSLLDVKGSVETARQANYLHVVTDERKVHVDQVVSELGRCKIDVAALQKTKLFGEALYRVGESVVVAAGRTVPGTGAVKQRGGWSCQRCIWLGK